MATRFRHGMNILGYSFCKNNGFIPIYHLPSENYQYVHDDVFVL